MEEGKGSDSTSMEIEKLKNELLAVLISADCGLTIKEIESDYLEWTGTQLPLLGFSSTEELIRSLTDTIYVNDKYDVPFLLPISDHATQQMKQLISEQKPRNRRPLFGALLPKDQLFQRIKTNVVMILLSCSMSLDQVLHEYRSRHGHLSTAKVAFGCSMRQALQNKLSEVIQVRHEGDTVILSLHKTHQSSLNRTPSPPVPPSSSPSSSSPQLAPQKSTTNNRSSEFLSLPLLTDLPQVCTVAQGPAVPYDPCIATMMNPAALSFNVVPTTSTCYFIPYNATTQPTMESSAASSLTSFLYKVLAVLKVSSPREFDRISLPDALTELYGHSPDPVLWNLTWEQMFTAYLPNYCDFVVKPDGEWTVRFIERHGSNDHTSTSQASSTKHEFSRFQYINTEKGVSTKDHISQTVATMDKASIEKVRLECNAILDLYPAGICFSEFKKVYQERTNTEFPCDEIDSSLLFGPQAVIWFSHRRCRDGWPLVISPGKEETNLPPGLIHGLHCLIYWVLFYHPNGLTESELRQLLQEHFAVRVEQDQLCKSLLELTDVNVTVRNLGQGELLVYLRSTEDENSCFAYVK